MHNITLNRVLQNMSNITDSIIIGELDNFIIIPFETHSKVLNLTLNDVKLLIDIYSNKHQNIALKSFIEDDDILTLLTYDISDELGITINTEERWKVKYAIMRRNKRINTL